MKTPQSVERKFVFYSHVDGFELLNSPYFTPYIARDSSMSGSLWRGGERESPRRRGLSSRDRNAIFAQARVVSSFFSYIHSPYTQCEHARARIRLPGESPDNAVTNVLLGRIAVERLYTREREREREKDDYAVLSSSPVFSIAFFVSSYARSLFSSFYTGARLPRACTPVAVCYAREVN